MAAITIPAKRAARRSRNMKENLKRLAVTSFTVAILALFLAPFLLMTYIALSTTEQMSALGAPAWPARPATFTYQGQELEVYHVPTESGIRDLAILKKGRRASTFVDPANPQAGEIPWQGSWRALDRPWSLAPAWSNFAQVWEQIAFPRLFFNTLAIAALGIIGTLISCTLVAYGFARFRIPGKDVLFTVLIATIFLPEAVTIVPTYTFFVKIGWVGTWLPLIVPHFFANAYNVFLLRQYFMGIPREMDEAAMLDGAGPFRVMWSVILPQAVPVLVAVALFHLVFAWNDFFGPLIYLSSRPDLQPLAVGLSRFQGIHHTNYPFIEAASLLTLIVPVLLFFTAQRVFMQGVVMTGVEK
jgi:multiple sugar transport system permease protein